jgi:hypothetical protein
MAGQKGLIPNVYSFAFPSTRADVEQLYPGMSTKAKKHLTALRVKRKSEETRKQTEEEKGLATPEPGVK